MQMTTRRRIPTIHAIPRDEANKGLNNHHDAGSNKSAQPITICVPSLPDGSHSSFSKTRQQLTVEVKGHTKQWIEAEKEST
jgi:hypothetical protein